MKKLLGLSLSLALLAMAVSPAFAQSQSSTVTVSVTAGTQSMVSTIAIPTATFGQHAVASDQGGATSGTIIVTDNTGNNAATKGHHVNATMSDLTCRPTGGTPEAGCAVKTIVDKTAYDSTTNVINTLGTSFALVLAASAPQSNDYVNSSGVCTDTFAELDNDGSTDGLTGTADSVVQSTSGCNHTATYRFGNTTISLDDAYSDGYTGTVIFTLIEA